MSKLKTFGDYPGQKLALDSKGNQANIVNKAAERVLNKKRDTIAEKVGLSTGKQRGITRGDMDIYYTKHLSDDAGITFEEANEIKKNWNCK
ncbi:MAG: hypothetical protein ABIH83_01390 [Candidatus Micrarchaeota archaeon]